MPLPVPPRPGRALLALLPAALAAGALAGCSGGSIENQFGVGKRSPDEFAVYRRAPLEIPPGYALRPPEPGATRPQEAPADEARTVLTGRPVAPAPAATPGAQALLGRLGVAEADPAIRADLAEDTGEVEAVGNTLFGDIFGFGGGSAAAGVLDPAAAGDESAEPSLIAAVPVAVSGPPAGAPDAPPPVVPAAPGGETPPFVLP